FAPQALYHEQIRSLGGKNLPLGKMDPARHWPDLFLAGDHCSPSLSWVDLSPASQRSVDSCSTILPRQEKPVNQFPVHVCRVLLRRGPDGGEVAYCPENDAPTGPLHLVRAGKTLNPAVMGKHPTLPVLPAAVDCLAYVVILFDSRAGEAAAQKLSE